MTGSLRYRIVILPDADKDIQLLSKNEPKAYTKVRGFINELCEHPTTGTGHPKPLGADKIGLWSRRITRKHRLVYKIDGEDISSCYFRLWAL